jgi:hypothetical protein
LPNTVAEPGPTPVKLTEQTSGLAPGSVQPFGTVPTAVFDEVKFTLPVGIYEVEVSVTVAVQVVVAPTATRLAPLPVPQTTTVVVVSVWAWARGRFVAIPSDNAIAKRITTGNNNFRLDKLNQTRLLDSLKRTSGTPNIRLP